MPWPQTYLVTQTRRQRMSGKGNQYSGSRQSDEPIWKVTMMSGFYPGRWLRFGFASEADAARFSLWQIYTPESIIRSTDANAEYIIDEPFQTFNMGLSNPYSDQSVLLESWVVPMLDNVHGNRIELEFPTRKHADQFSRGRSLSIQDLLGTTQAMLTDNMAKLQAIANSLASAESETAAAKSQAAAAATEAKAKAIAAVQANILAARPGEVFYSRNDFTVANAGAMSHLFVVNGGSAGWYKTGPLLVGIPIDGSVAYEAAGMVYYDAGKWTHPYNGFFDGFFANALDGLFYLIPGTTGVYD